MSAQHRVVETNGIERLPKMLDQRINSVFVYAQGFVRQPVPLQVERDDPVTSIGESRDVEPEDVDCAAPSVHQNYRRPRRIATLCYSYPDSGLQPREAHAICGIAGGKHLAGTEDIPATEPDHA